MKFLYKIHSGYDGFSPRRIPERFVERNLLRLGWDRYIDAIEEGNEVWIYFHGPHRFENGVYVKGFIRSINSTQRSVLLRVREYSTDNPLTHKELSERVAAVVQPRYRQVFLLPEEWIPIPQCSIDSTADTCRRRLCDTCPTWASLRLIAPGSFSRPTRMPRSINCVSAYWVIPSRCYLGRRVERRIRNTSELFYRFKVGEQALAFPLALAIFQRLRQENLLDIDAVVPIPLSPDKAERGEIHRTQILSRELGRLLGAPVLNLLKLKEPLVKKRALSLGVTARQYENQYYNNLAVVSTDNVPDRILLIDDVCTRGSTLAAGALRLAEMNRGCQIVAATAGQMILREVVRDEEELLAH